MPFPQSDNTVIKAYKGFLVSCAFGSVLFPIFLTLAALLLPWQGLVCVLALELVLAAIPLKDAPPPKFVQRFLYKATSAAVEWMSIKVVYKKEDFRSPGPYVLGT